MTAEFLAMLAVVALTVLVLLEDSGALLVLLPVAAPATFVLCVSLWWWWFKKKRRPPPPAPAAHVFIVVAHDPVAQTHEVRAFTTYELASAEFARLKGVYPPEMVTLASRGVEG